jgi:superfamily II DNA or RNA helicase
MFDINKFKTNTPITHRYEKHLQKLKDKDSNFITSYIEETVSRAIANLSEGVKSFIIYGAPQSGKTEMMIALTAKLLDLGHKIIIILLNDNVGLLEQNLRRFAKADIDPDPKIFKEILDDSYEIKDHEWIIFCKKNAADLTKLIRKLEDHKKKVIIDDEADYASPNSKINKNEKTKINDLIGKLLHGGIYIGVTATPARLDLNSTFDNANDRWVHFPAHSKYTGQDIFFPFDLTAPKYILNILPPSYDDPKFLREALFRFMINVAYLNLYQNEKSENYSMLIHTSGRKSDHLKDQEAILKTLNILKDQDKFEKYVKQIWDLAKKDYDENKANDMVDFIITNRNRNKVLVINSEKDKENLEKAANPIALFTIAIGGNIVSRGVTFNNLLSMYFTRDVKSKIQQDTYIQRARMFGNRGRYLHLFELSIPEQLYLDWQRCFAFHKLALDSVNSGNPPVWLEDNRVKAVASSSIAKTTVEMDSGEMSFEIFKYNSEIDRIIKQTIKPIDKLKELRHLLGDDVIPNHLINFIDNFNPDGSDSLAIHESTDISNRGEDTDKENIYRAKGLIGSQEMEKTKFPHAIHHIKIFYNKDTLKSRIFYRFIGSIKFLKNTRNNA